MSALTAPLPGRRSSVMPSAMAQAASARAVRRRPAPLRALLAAPGDLLLDFSKNRITAETMRLLLDLARAG